MFIQKNFKEIAIDWQQAKAGFVKHSTMCAYMLVLKTHLLPYDKDRGDECTTIHNQKTN